MITITISQDGNTVKEIVVTEEQANKLVAELNTLDLQNSLS